MKLHIPIWYPQRYYKPEVIRTALAFNLSLSRLIARRIRAQKRSCYLNAWRSVECCTELDGLFYTEGWVVEPQGIVIEHAWLEQDRIIIDPTLNSPPCIAYFPSLRLNRVQAIEQAISTGGKLHFTHRDNHDHLSVEQIQQHHRAMIAAYYCIGADHLAKQIEKQLNLSNGDYST